MNQDRTYSGCIHFNKDRTCKTAVESDPHGTEAHSAGSHFDTDKLDLTLIPPAVAPAIARPMAYGAKKYTRGGWRSVPEAGRRYHASLLRHLNAYARGEDIDSRSGLPHLDHAICNLGFLVSLRDDHGIDIGDWRKQ